MIFLKSPIDIVVIGLGYVGLPLALHLASQGEIVQGMDKDINKIISLKHAQSYIDDVSDATLANALQRKIFSVSLPNQDIEKAAYIIVCVPTPFDQQKGVPDLTALLSASTFIANHLRKGQTVIYESSTFPGTTEEVIAPILEKSGLSVGKDFYLGYSPERIDPGNKQYHFGSIPKVVSGLTKTCLQKVLTLYRTAFEQVVPVSSPRVAELCKLFENIQRLVNISLVNEMEVICYKMGISFRESLAAAATKPFGFTPYTPGPGIGGHCIPVDPQYFQWKAKQQGLHSSLIEEALRVNNDMPKEVVSRIEGKINQKKLIDHHSVPRILLIGLTYKKDVSDIRESPAIDIFRLLLDKGYHVEYHDPLIPRVNLNQQLKHSVPLTLQQLQHTDVVAILTDHSRINWKLVKEHSRSIVDTRGIMKIE